MFGDTAIMFRWQLGGERNMLTKLTILKVITGALPIAITCSIFTGSTQFAVAQTASQGIGSPAQSLIDEGAALDADSRYSEAVAIFAKAIKASPDDARAYYRRGLSNFHLADYKDATADLSKAIALNTKYQDAYLIRAEAFFGDKQYEKSIADVSWVTANDPQFKEAFRLESGVYEKMGKNDLAKSYKDQSAPMHYRKYVAEGEPGVPDFSKYVPELQRKVKAHWRPPHRTVDKTEQVYFRVHRDGTVSDAKVQTSSNDEIFDEAGINAVQKVKNVDHFPPGAPEEVEISFSLDYHCHKGSRALPPVLSSAVAAPTSASKPDKCTHRGLELESKQKHAEALAEYLEALSLYKQANPVDAEQVTAASKRVGYCYLRMATEHDNDAKQYLKYLHLASFYDPYQQDIQDGLDDAIKQQGKDPKRYDDRVLLGDEASSSGDFAGAIVEYQAALILKDDSATRQKLESCQKAQAANPAPKVI
jgi:TonB family protein